MIGRTFLQRYAKRIAALALVGGLYGAARVPALPPAERAELASRFRFVKLALPELAVRPRMTVRDVHPSLQHIAAWISSVGASVALNDLDGDGLPNDVCYVDTRTDEVVVAPVPPESRGHASRYEPFALDPAPLTYDRTRMAPMGCLPGDLNEDGLVDLLVYYWGRTPVAFLRRTPALTTSRLAGPEYVPVEVRQPIERWYTNAATLADIDGDGHHDLIVGNYFPDGSRILDAQAGGREAMQASMSRAGNSGRHHLLRFADASAGDRPSIRFQEVDALTEADAFGWTLAVGAADLDGDLLPELYFANDFGPDQLFHNRSTPGAVRLVPLHGIKGWTTPSSKVLGRDSFKGMGVDFGDVNGDGWLDIYVSNIAAEYALEESHFVFVSTGEIGRMRDGIAPYVDRSERLGLSRSGWAWDAKLADFDNDGVLEAMQATGFVRGRVNRWPELHELAMANDQLLADPRSWPRVTPGDDLSGRERNPFFARASDGRYADVAPELGVDEPHVSRGIAIADVDGDGLLDFAVANQWDASHLYANRRQPSRAFLGLHVRLPLARDAAVRTRTIALDGHPTAHRPGRPAIGAAVTVHLPDGRRLVAQVDGGNGHSGRRSADLHFGLGDLTADTPVRVDLRWRTGDGRVARDILRLTPGWHTVLLGSSIPPAHGRSED